MLLAWLILIPLIGGLLCWQSDRFGNKPPRWIALITMTTAIAATHSGQRAGFFETNSMTVASSPTTSATSADGCGSVHQRGGPVSACSDGSARCRGDRRRVACCIECVVF